MQLLKTEPRGRIDGILKFKTIFIGEVRQPGIIRMLRSFGKQRISQSQDNEAYIRSVLRALKRSTWRKGGKISLYNKLVWIYKKMSTHWVGLDYIVFRVGSPLACFSSARAFLALSRGWGAHWVRISNYETIVGDDGVIPLFCYNYHSIIIPPFILPEMLLKFIKLILKSISLLLIV